MNESPQELLEESALTAQTVKPDKERAKVAFELEQDVKNLKVEVGRNFLELGLKLKTFRDNQYYLDLGFASITEWLSSPDISISAPWAWNLISIYELLIIKFKLAPERVLATDYSKLHQILPLIKKHPEDLEKWLTAAGTLRRIDLQKEIREIQIKDRRQEIDDSEVLKSPYRGRIIQGDALVEMKEIEDESVDAVITDPPYFLTSKEGESGVREGKGDWDKAENYQEIVDFNRAWITEAKRILKKNGVIFVTGTLHNIFTIGHLLKEQDFYIVRDIVWVKPFIQRQVNLYTLAPAHEIILWARKGTESLCNLTEVTRDVWEVAPKAKFGHPAEKPEALIRKIVEMGTDPGQTILDPFAGSGTVLEVAKQLKREFIGIELDDYWYRVCLKRLGGIKKI